MSDVEDKQTIRRRARAARLAQPDRQGLSRQIVAKLMSLPEYAAAATVQFYVDVRAEVQTRHALPGALASGKRIVVPWCSLAGELELFSLRSLNELEVGRYGILEPRVDLREREERRVAPAAVDLVVVPGVAFDRRGGRIGHGRGYYDRLLRRVRPDARLIALAFECQLFEEVPMLPHDTFMDKVITEAGVYEGIGRWSGQHTVGTLPPRTEGPSQPRES